MSQSLRDEMDFRALVGDVKPLPQRNRADTGPQRQRPSEAQLARRESAAARAGHEERLGLRRARRGLGGVPPGRSSVYLRVSWVALRLFFFSAPGAT